MTPHRPLAVLALAVGLIGWRRRLLEGHAGAPSPTAGRPAVAVTVVPAAASTLTERIEVVGTLEPKFSADVKSEVTGTVTEVYVTEWVRGEARAHRSRGSTRRETEAGIEALKAGEAQARVGRGAREARVRARRAAEAVRPDHAAGLRRREDGGGGGRGGDRRGAGAGHAPPRRGWPSRFIKAPMDGVVALRGVSVGDRVENMGGNAAVFRIVDNRAARPDRVGARRRGSRPSASGSRSSSRPTRVPGPHVHGQGDVHQPRARRGEPVREGRRRGAATPTARCRGGAFVKGRIVVGQRGRRAAGAASEALHELEPRARARRRCSSCRGDAGREAPVQTGTTNGGVGRGAVGRAARRPGRHARRLRAAGGRPRRSWPRAKGRSHVPLGPVHQAAGGRDA